jgi:hypothetical protein
MSDKEALNRFPEQAQISRFEHPEEAADSLASAVRPANEMDGGCFAPHRWRRD